MYQKRIKRDFIHASKPNSDKPLKTKDITEEEKRTIDICLNCTKPHCRWGTCKDVRGENDLRDV